jgi:hypothetical protein
MKRAGFLIEQICDLNNLYEVFYKAQKAKKLTHNMYEITYTLPESKHTKSKILKMDEDQTELYEIIKRNF